MRLHRSREGMDTILMSVIVMSVIVHRFTPNLKGTRSRKLEEKLTPYYNDRPKMRKSNFVTIVLKRRGDDRPDPDG
jgi:hypothetical protein